MGDPFRQDERELADYYYARLDKLREVGWEESRENREGQHRVKLTYELVVAVQPCRCASDLVRLADMAERVTREKLRGHGRTEALKELREIINDPIVLATVPANFLACLGSLVSRLERE